jgi:hypothetical protein
MRWSNLLAANAKHMNDDPRMPHAVLLVRRWCPKFSEQELIEAAQNFLAYMDVVRRIYERLIAEGHDVGKIMEEWKNKKPSDSRS